MTTEEILKAIVVFLLLLVLSIILLFMATHFPPATQNSEIAGALLGAVGTIFAGWLAWRAVEKQLEAMSYLRNVLSESEHRRLLDDKIHLLPGEFGDHVQRIIEDVKRRGRAGRTLFFLDQFGYTDVPLGTIRTILAELENAEVILTFATDFLIDYLSEDESSQRILERIGISLPPKEIATAKDEREWRRAIQFRLHREIPERTGARYYTPFFIRSADSHRDFWLIHLSGHWKARDVMVGLHWQENSSFAHFGGSGLGMLGYDQTIDAELTKQRLLPGFFFDQTALISSQEELMGQLPRHLHRYEDGIPFSDLFAKLTNETPVTADIMRDVLKDLVREGLIQVRDKHGAARRAGVRHGTDVVIPSKQRRLFQT